MFGTGEMPLAVSFAAIDWSMIAVSAAVSAGAGSSARRGSVARQSAAASAKMGRDGVNRFTGTLAGQPVCALLAGMDSLTVVYALLNGVMSGGFQKSARPATYPL